MDWEMKANGSFTLVLSPKERDDMEIVWEMDTKLASPSVRLPQETEDLEIDWEAEAKKYLTKRNPEGVQYCITIG